MAHASFDQDPFCSIHETLLLNKYFYVNCLLFVLIIIIFILYNKMFQF